MSDAFTGHDDNRDEAARPGDGGPFRVLVAIASFGTKNLPYLEHVIGQYQSMTLDIDIVLNTEANKPIDPMHGRCSNSSVAPNAAAELSRRCSLSLSRCWRSAGLSGATR